MYTVIIGQNHVRPSQWKQQHFEGEIKDLINEKLHYDHISKNSIVLYQSSLNKSM